MLRDDKAPLNLTIELPKATRIKEDLVNGIFQYMLLIFISDYIEGGESNWKIQSWTSCPWVMSLFGFGFGAPSTVLKQFKSLTDNTFLDLNWFGPQYIREKMTSVLFSGSRINGDAFMKFLFLPSNVLPFEGCQRTIPRRSSKES